MHTSVRTRALQCPNSGICDAPQQITYMGLCHAQQTKIRHNCCNPDPAKCRGPQKKPTLFCPVLSFPLHLRAVWEHMGVSFQGFLQAYLATRMYAVKTDVGTTTWVHPASGVPQGGAEGQFLFLLVTLPLAF